MGLFGKKKKRIEDIKDEGGEEEPEEQEEQEKDEYTYEFLKDCENCGTEKEFDIPVKTRVDDFLKNKKCEHCECNLIEEEVN